VLKSAQKPNKQTWHWILTEDFYILRIRVNISSANILFKIGQL
jgi:hypothetical protein